MTIERHALNNDGHSFNGHFNSRTTQGLVGTKMSRFWALLELRMTEAVVTTGATRHAKLRSNHHHQRTNTQLFASRKPSPAVHFCTQHCSKYTSRTLCDLHSLPDEARPGYRPTAALCLASLDSKHLSPYLKCIVKWYHVIDN